MKNFIFVLLLVCFPYEVNAWMAKVVSVTDGDTIKVFNAEQGQVKVRLYGIDAPEKGQPYGKAAAKYLAFLIADATVEIETVTTDRYGRLVGIIQDHEKNINQEMVRSGYVWVYKKYCDRDFCDYWLALEDEIRTDRLGLWQEPDPVPPWEWRRRN